MKDTPCLKNRETLTARKEREKAEKKVILRLARLGDPNAMILARDVYEYTEMTIMGKRIVLGEL